MPDPLEVTPARLFAVADTVLDLLDAADGAASIEDIAAEVDKWRESARPAPHEVDAATKFLIRLGYIEKVDRI